MSTADELSKLNELRMQGAITEKEFNKQKRQLLTPKRWYKSWWVRLPLSLIGLMLLIDVFSGEGNHSGKVTASDIPSCDSQQARDLISAALKNNALSGVVNLQLLDLTNAQQVSFDDTSKTRNCEATATLNSGTQNIVYHMWPSSDGRSILILVQRAN